jgi:tetratricopeptide (TPR) repeat protein
MERCTEAIDVFELALDTAPMESSARGWVLYGLALAQRDCGHPAAAIETLESALQEGSDQELSTAIGDELRALRPQ